MSEDTLYNTFFISLKFKAIIMSLILWMFFRRYYFINLLFLQTLADLLQVSCVAFQCSYIISNWLSMCYSVLQFQLFIPHCHKGKWLCMTKKKLNKIITDLSCFPSLLSPHSFFFSPVHAIILLDSLTKFYIVAQKIKFLFQILSFCEHVCKCFLQKLQRKKTSRYILFSLVKLVGYINISLGRKKLTK